jgi:hypothetical protein
MKFKRCVQCRFKLSSGACPNGCDPNRIIVARKEIASDPPKLIDFHLGPVEEPTQELPDPYESMYEVVEARRS